MSSVLRGRPPEEPVRRAEAMRCWVACLLVGVVTAWGASALGGVTPVDMPRRSATDPAHILSHIYGGHFVARGEDFTNGVVTANRVNDSGTGSTDEVWSQPLLSAKAVAAFGPGKQSFGILGGSSGGTYEPLFSVKGRRYHASGSSLSAATPSTFRFALAGRGGIASSDEADNPGGADQLITYQISGAGATGANTWVLFWDGRSSHSDREFHDLVVEVKTGHAVSPQAVGGAVAPRRPVFIPVPNAFWTGLSGLLGLAVLAGIRRMIRTA